MMIPTLERVKEAREIRSQIRAVGNSLQNIQVQTQMIENTVAPKTAKNPLQMTQTIQIGVPVMKV